MKSRRAAWAALAPVLAIVAFCPAAASGNDDAASFGGECDPFALTAPLPSAARVSEAARRGRGGRAERRGGVPRGARAGARSGNPAGACLGPVRVPVYRPRDPGQRRSRRRFPHPDRQPDDGPQRQLRRRTGGDNTGISFELIDTDVTINPDWSPLQPETPEEAAAKTALREGGARSLNLYIVELRRCSARRPRRSRARRPTRRTGSWSRSASSGRGAPIRGGRHRHPRGRALARPLPHLPGGLRPARRLRRRHRTGGDRALRLPGRSTAARAEPTIPSTTSCPTPTTPACTCSPPARGTGCTTRRGLPQHRTDDRQPGDLDLRRGGGGEHRGDRRRRGRALVRDQQPAGPRDARRHRRGAHLHPRRGLWRPRLVRGPGTDIFGAAATSTVSVTSSRPRSS